MTRLSTYSKVATSLALYSDNRLLRLVETATHLGASIGGTSALADVDGTPVFVKLVPLTTLELLPEHSRSTANIFGLPAYCHYGIGSPGFGAWREVDVHALTTKWVVEGEYAGFPLMYHWRVLPTRPPVLAEELADVDKAVAFWGGRDEVRQRIEGLEKSQASVVLFLEYIPQNLDQWLRAQLELGDEAANAACAMVERELGAGTAFMNGRGLLHFDAHFENILTDGQQLYFGDYGLALSSAFELSADEAEFFDRHQSYDRTYTTTHLVNWLVTALYGHRGEERNAYVRAVASGEQPTGIPETAADVITRNAPLAVTMTDFYWQLRQKSLETPYPNV